LWFPVVRIGDKKGVAVLAGISRFYYSQAFEYSKESRPFLFENVFFVALYSARIQACKDAAGAPVTGRYRSCSTFCACTGLMHLHFVSVPGGKCRADGEPL
jgi:hypothetical protein